ncbi:transmembrane protein 66, isoform CRA_b [Rattus norvegicus]|uniref:Store-operated calcium entry-associated regulatory factor n=1 Tax=Rattus norvegicus TaxID=10116 RepID=A6IVP2_RAT|nr:transmembrane protein 66, isoform CRA_b [Rattus norvegicus]
MAVAAVGRPRAVRCLLLLLLSFLLVAGPALCWKNPDRILLRDVEALTLYSDRYTTSRRLDPIPQLKCVGGTAGCDAYGGDPFLRLVVPSILPFFLRWRLEQSCLLTPGWRRRALFCILEYRIEDQNNVRIWRHQKTVK